MSMEARFYEDINEFCDIAFPFLLKREVINGFFIDILHYLKKNIHKYEEEIPLLITLTEGEEVKLISQRTPPYPLTISYTDDMRNIERLVEELSKREEKLPGVYSFKKVAEKFTKLWCEKSSLNPLLIREEPIYKLEEVSKETLGDKQFSVATKKDQSIVLNWTREMMVEALADVTQEELDRNINIFRIEFENDKSQIFILFDNNEPVSIARKMGNTLNGINLVYTPPSLRRRGYATECVAKLSKLLLEEGNKYCFLETDLSNPASNSIYQKIGYRPVIDVDEYKFLPK